MKKYLTVFLLLLFASVILAKETISSNLASLLITPDLITFQPEEEVESYTLTISGPDGIVFHETFSGLHMASFEPVNVEGNLLQDGIYSFEMIAAPILTEAQKSAMLQARASGDYSAVKILIPRRSMIKSGSFGIQNGYFMTAKSESELSGSLQASDGRDPGDSPGNPDDNGEGGSSSQTSRYDDPARDQVFTDDLIVSGSMCVGFDCATGESFNFDTIRLKENNLRIRTDDTSATSGFPNADWQITFNDSAQGGKNKFSVEDLTNTTVPFTILTGAPSNSLYINEIGRLGLGTSVPLVSLHIKDGNSPALRLDQDQSGGFSAQTWDIAGNETNFFIRDVTNGNRLPFRVGAGAPDATFFIGGSGDTGMGTKTPDARTHIIGDVLIEDTDGQGILDNSEPNLYVRGDKARFLLSDTSTDVNEIPFTLKKASTVNFQMIDTSASGTNGNWSIGVNGNAWFLSKTGGTGKEMQIANDGTFTLKAGGTQTAQVTTSGDLCLAGTVTCASDRDKKENFENIDPANVLNRVLALPVSTWNYKSNDASVRHMGVMAQDFHNAFGLGANNTSIAPLDTAGAAFGAIQGLNRIIEEKDTKIIELTRQAEGQAAELAAQKSQLNTQKSLLAAQEARLKALEDALLNQ